MSSNSTSPGGESGGYGGGAPPTFDQILYMSLDSDPVTLTVSSRPFYVMKTNRVIRLTL